MKNEVFVHLKGALFPWKNAPICFVTSEMLEQVDALSLPKAATMVQYSKAQAIGESVQHSPSQSHISSEYLLGNFA
jgi:hypothetical protein